jgi:hypothetical protein
MGAMLRAAPALLALAVSAAGQSMPAEMREALAAEFHFTPADIGKVESGRPVAKMASTGRPDDVRMGGAILIKVSSVAFIKAFRDVERFQKSDEVIQTGTFSMPPVAADIAGFQFPDLTKASVAACHPGACAYKLPADIIQDLRTKIDWNAPDANAQAQALVHQIWIARLNGYERNGDSALSVYYDTPSPFSVAEGLHSLLAGETRLASRFPGLMRYAENYPADKPPDTDSLFYWQEAAFGLKHVVRSEHMIVQEAPAPEGPHYAVITKMLFASHYFRAGFEFDYVYPVRTASGAPAVFFVAAQRSYVDGMTGVKGAVVRRIAESRSPATLETNLQLSKQRLEHP